MYGSTHTKLAHHKRKFIHVTLTCIRIVFVIVAVHFGVRFAEMHGLFNRFGKTADFTFGSVVDYLLFGIGEDS